MTGRKIIMIGIAGVILLVVFGAAMSMWSASRTASNPGVASIDATSGTWYGANGAVQGAPQAYYVVGQQAQYAPPQTRVEYVTVPAPVIIGTLDDGSSNGSSNAKTSTRTAPQNYNYQAYNPAPASLSGSPYPTYADYEARYYATHGYDTAPSYSQSYPQMYPQTYGYGSTNPVNYGPSFGSSHPTPPPYTTYAEYQSWYQYYYQQS